ncbi:DeoR/GlpR family DNA-binding transcription regulator [Sulfitobacter sp. LCG007]
MTLNIPDTRQRELAERLRAGTPLSLSDIAEEFGVSIDTARRDVIALEASGLAERVRGGVVPLMPPAAPLREKLSRQDPGLEPIARAAAGHLASASTILVDGGQTTLAVARALTPRPDLLVATPSPWVAIACHEAGIDVHLIGGHLSASGGIATGTDCSAQLAALAADVALLGACGIDADFGLSSDILAESETKRRMARNATRVIVVSAGAKVGRRARHRTLAPEGIDMLVTDAAASNTAAFGAAGIEVHHA